MNQRPMKYFRIFYCTTNVPIRVSDWKESGSGGRKWVDVVTSFAVFIQFSKVSLQLRNGSFQFRIGPFNGFPGIRFK